jgi:hypothetical protein
MMRTNGASSVKNTPGWICAVRDRPPASGVTSKVLAQKLIAGHRQDRSGVVAVGLVELVVEVLRLVEAVDDVPEQQRELRHLARSALGEVPHHLVGHLVLRGRSARAAAVTGGVKHQLSAGADRGGSARIAAQDLGECQARLGQAARRREGQRRDTVLAVQLVDAAVGGRVGSVPDAKQRGIGRRLRLREYRARELS